MKLICNKSAIHLKALDAFDRADYQAALQEWRPLAEQGQACAQNNLGSMYHLRRDYGISVEGLWQARCVRLDYRAIQRNMSG